MNGALDRNVYYREKWNGLVKSRLYLAFVLSLTIWAVGIGIRDAYAIIVQFFSAPGRAFFELLIAMPLSAGVVVLLIGLWFVRTKAASSGKGPTVGLGMLFWFYFALLALTVLCFVITLPMFTEWLPYQESYGQPLQIVYCIYILQGIECALVMSVVKKMRTNLWFWEGSMGPVVALTVMLILRTLANIGVAIGVASVDGNTVILALLFAVSMTLLIILLFRYRFVMSRVKH